MKFGVREICDVVFKATADVKIGNTDFKKGQPVLYIDSAKTSTLEGAATTVYAQGGKGNTRLLAWEGEKTLTFTVEDALLSKIGFSILSGAGLFGGEEGKSVHVHSTAFATANGTKVELDDEIDATANVYVMAAEEDGSIIRPIEIASVSGKEITLDESYTGSVFVDYYVIKSETVVSEMQIDAGTFGGYYYVEASTLFRDKATGKDMPAEITLPKVKIQSNFTFSMASTGDPSTFNFTMDAFPGKTYFDNSREVLCVIQIINEKAGDTQGHSVMHHLGDNEESI